MTKKRTLRDHWKVQYEEASFPFIQKGWILPPERQKEFDPFILMAEDWFKRGAFSDHPHRGFQTVTYVVDGRLEHIDNGGGREVLEPGDVQYMNAGGGARHAEEGVEDDIAHTLQLWLNLPASEKRSAHSYQNVYQEDAPVVPFDGGSVRVFSGDVAGVHGPMESVVPITLSELVFEAGAGYELVLPADHNAFFYVLAGEVEVDGERVGKHGVGLLSYEADGEGVSGVRFDAVKRRTRVLVYSGVPIEEEVVAYGPFVMNSMEEIKEAYRDYHAGKFGPAAR